MSTLSDLGLPEPAAAGASPDTLAALGLPEPRPRLTIPDFLSRDFRNPFPRTAAGARFDPFSPEAIAQRDAPIVTEYPLEALASIVPGVRATQAVAGPLKSLPWLVRSATTGAAAGATGGAIAESGRGPGAAARGAGAGALAGAVLSPPLEAAVGAVASRLAPRAPVPASAPISPVEPVETLPPARVPPVAEAPPAAGGGWMEVDRFSSRSEAQADLDAYFKADPKIRVRMVQRDGEWAIEMPGDALKEVPDAPVVRLEPKGVGMVSGESPSQLAARLEEAYPGLKLDFEEHNGVLVVPKIVVPISERNRGVGSAVMRELAQYADERGMRLALTPSGDFGGDVSRLKKFYGRFGFVKNTGRSRDLSISEDMIREPSSTPVAEAPPAAAPARPVGTPGTGPVSAENAQQFPKLGEFAEQVKNDPNYLARLKELGGGRVVSNEETLRRAAEAGPMHPDELAAWPADAPIDPVTQTRGLLTFDHFQQERVRAIAAGDLTAAADAQRTIARLMPGVSNLRATGGRVTQAQAMFVQDEMSKILDSLADMQAKGVPFDQVTRRANEMLRASKQAARTKGALAEWRDALSALETAATWAKLTSPVTHAINFTSNALNAAIVRPIEQAVRSGTYLVQGNRPAAEAELQAVFGTRMGFVSGMKRWAAAIMDDAEQGALAGEYDRNIPLPKAARPFDVFRQLSGADAFWKGILEDSRIYQLAYRSAREQGLSGRALAARIEELRLSPPASWKTEAAEYAREYTFQMDPDTFLKKIQGIGNLPGMKFVLPFTKTPYNLQKFYMQRSPYGLASRRNIGGLMAGGQEQAEAAGRLGAGIALSAGALALVSSTDATGAYPTDPRERARWQAEGIKEYSLRLPDGRYLQYSRFSPLGQYIGQAVALRDALASGRPEAQALASGMLAATMRQTLDLPFMSSLKDLLDAVTGASEPTGSQKRAPERFGTGIVTGFVPNVLRDVRVQTDPVMRETRGVAQGVQNMIPGQSQRLPASIDVLGRERTYEPDRLTRGLKVLSTRRETPETRLLAEVGWNPSNPNPSLTMKDGSKRTLEGADLERFRREMGEATVRALAPFVRNREALLKLDRDTQVERLEDAVNLERKKVRKKWATNR